MGGRGAPIPPWLRARGRTLPPTARPAALFEQFPQGRLGRLPRRLHLHLHRRPRPDLLHPGHHDPLPLLEPSPDDPHAVNHLPELDGAVFYLVLTVHHVDVLLALVVLEGLV